MKAPSPARACMCMYKLHKGISFFKMVDGCSEFSSPRGISLLQKGISRSGYLPAMICSLVLLSPRAQKSPINPFTIPASKKLYPGV